MNNKDMTMSRFSKRFIPEKESLSLGKKIVKRDFKLCKNN